ncbi:MAG: glycosyltransferase family 4 protein [Bacteroidales bacterium]|nr:glycosyltransferase family 4 protein [Bacteroidales bacterium]
MKKVLIITYYWPPSGGGGVQRWVKFVKYMRDFGWEPIVFTPENPERPALDESLLKEIPKGITVLKNRVWEPYSYYKKLTGKKKSDQIQTAFLAEKKSTINVFENLAIWVRGNFFIPDARKFWIKPSIQFLDTYLQNNPVDVIISTGPPHSTHMIAASLKRKLNIPWLADFRDPWTNIDYYHELRLSKWADRKHHRLEKQVLKEADDVIVISPGMQREFETIVPRAYTVIPNGYDDEDAKQSGVTSQSKNKFSITHVGSLTKTRNPENLWQALRELVSEDAGFSKCLEIHNVGKIDFLAVESLEKFQLKKYLRKTDYLPHDQVIVEQQKASVLLLLVNDTPNAKLILTGKIFEYLSSQRPIICIAPEDGDAASVINSTNSGKVFGFQEVDSLKRYLFESFQLFKHNKLHVTSIGVEKYERKNLTYSMCSQLNKLIE